MRPARAKALIINAFALAGRFAIFNPYTQGAALGYVLIGPSARIIDLSHALLLLIACGIILRKFAENKPVNLRKTCGNGR